MRKRERDGEAVQPPAWEGCRDVSECVDSWAGPAGINQALRNGQTRLGPSGVESGGFWWASRAREPCSLDQPEGLRSN